MPTTKLEEIGESRHRPIRIKNFTDHTGRLNPRQTGKIDPGFGMPCTGQHPPGLSHNRKNVSWAHNILAGRVFIHRGADSVSTVGCRDAGTDAIGSFDRDCKVRRVARVVVVHHQWQLKMLAPLFSQGQAD